LNDKKYKFCIELFTLLTYHCDHPNHEVRKQRQPDKRHHESDSVPLPPGLSSTIRNRYI